VIFWEKIRVITGEKPSPRLVRLWRKKQTARRRICLRAKKLFKYQALLVLFLLMLVASSCKCSASGDLMISAIQTSGNNANDDFIEIYNQSCDDKDISGWKIRKRTSSGTESSIKVISNNTIIHAKSYFLWSNSSLAEVIGADQSTSAILSDNYSIALIDDDKIVDSITWGNNTNPFSPSYLYSKNPIKLQTLKKDADNNFSTELNYSPKNSSFVNSAELELCPKKEPTPAATPKEYSDKIEITELLPNPDDGDEEYIELYNGSDEKIDLDGWSLHDASQSGEYVFSSADSVEAKKYFVIYKSDFKFALNDSGDESVTLFDPNKKEVSKVSYNGSKKGISYNFDGNDWHWSEFLTPGKENIFEKVPAGELDVDDYVYVDVYANFEILGLSDNAKVTWDFGDGHKSYIQKTRHKYAETGKYEASVKYSEGSEDVVKNFTVDVGEVPHPEVKIISVNANPVGSDTDNETITLQNKSKKKVNLNGWSIATGWKKLLNHPISEDFEIKAGKEKEITREFSKFTLNNTKGKIELRYPDGEVAYSVKYNKKKDSVMEGELYVKVKGGWAWVANATSEKSIKSVKFIKQEEPNNLINNNQEETNSEQENTDNNAENIPDEDIVVQPKIERENKLALNDKNIFKIELADNSPRVLGAETVREVDGAYYFTPEYPQEEHYAVTFLKNIFTLINLKINTLINYFFS
jgi:hypothetical protein